MCVVCMCDLTPLTPHPPGVTGSSAFAAWDAGFDVWLGNCRCNAPRAHQGETPGPQGETPGPHVPSDVKQFQHKSWTV